MERTPDHQRQIDEAIASGQRRIIRKATPEEAARHRQAVQEELAAKDETIAAHRRQLAAESEPGIYGDVRRAINARHLLEHHRRLPLSTFGLDRAALADFREGLAPLPPDDFRRLVDALGLQLVQTIPPRRQPEQIAL